MSSASAIPEPAPSATARAQAFVGQNAPVLSIAVFFVGMSAVFAISAEAFLSSTNLLNLLRQSAPLVIVAAAMTFVITSAGIDLSVGSTVALISAAAALSLQAGIPWALVLILMIGLGALIGLGNGYFVAYEGIPAFIVTLASLSMVRGVALLLTEGMTIPIARDIPFIPLGRGWLFGIPIPAILALVVLVISYVLLTRMPYGQYITGIGANAEAVRRAGVNIRAHILSVYVLTGIAAAIAGIVIAARLGSGSANAAVGFELQVIAAVVIGGTNLFGGRGTIVGTVLGALTIVVIGNGLILVGLSPFYTQIVTGAILLGAIWINTRLFTTSRFRRRQKVTKTEAA
ncbi:MAG: ABC transporter permease [Chloroflexota bacterium]